MSEIINRPIWAKKGNKDWIQVLDQRYLPHKIVIKDLENSNAVVEAITEMVVRGAPLIGVTAAFGVYFAYKESLDEKNFQKAFDEKIEKLKSARPTAVNLNWAIHTQLELIKKSKINTAKELFENAQKIAEDDVQACKKIGEYGILLLHNIYDQKKETVNILTHCNAGWLACIEWGTATAPIYMAHQKGIPVHVWVDETRPRNQGAGLTAWELQQAGIPYTVITDNAGGHLMQQGMVDICITGTDRTTFTGDVANKIGTYLKALAARDNRIPFYVALPSSTIDWQTMDGVNDIEIEERNEDEVKYVQGWHDGEIKKVLITPKEANAANYAFDVTPARLITGLITERGICAASQAGIASLFPEKNILSNTISHG